MKREEKIRKSEDRSRLPERQSRAGKTEVARLNDKVGQGSWKSEVGSAAMYNVSVVSFAADFGKLIKEIEKRTGLQPRQGNYEYRISNIESGICAHKNVSHSLFLHLCLKLMTGCISSFGQLKQTANDNSVQGTKNKGKRTKSHGQRAGRQSPATSRRLPLKEIQQFFIKLNSLWFPPSGVKTRRERESINHAPSAPCHLARVGGPFYRRLEFAGDIIIN